MPLKTLEEEIQELTVNLTKDTSVDAAEGAVLSEVNCIYTLTKEPKMAQKVFLYKKRVFCASQLAQIENIKLDRLVIPGSMGS